MSTVEMLIVIAFCVVEVLKQESNTLRNCTVGWVLCFGNSKVKCKQVCLMAGVWPKCKVSDTEGWDNNRACRECAV